MSDHRFDYPTAAASVANIVFTTAARLIEDPDELRFNDEIGESKGGSDYVREYGDDQNRYTFSAILPRASMAAAKTFFGTVKRVNTFQWTDDAAAVRTVRLMNDSIRFVPLSGIYVIITLELKEQ
jgi:hypothetical protein